MTGTSFGGTIYDETNRSCGIRMKIMRVLCPLIQVLILVGFVCTPVNATNYRFTTMDVPGFTYTVVVGINDSGQISGNCGFNSQNVGHGFIYSGGQFTIFDVPGGMGKTQGWGINGTGKVTGSYTDINGRSHGFTYDKGTFFYPLDVSGASDTFGVGINSQSQIVGYCFGITIGFLYANGSYQELIAPGSTVTLALGINDAGEILGYYKDENVINPPLHGYILNNGQYTTLDCPQATGTILYGKNAAGLIVGAQRDSNNNMHGFVYNGRTFTTVEPSGVLRSWATGINGRGQIVGSYMDQNNNWHGFLANPSKGVPAIYELLLSD